MPQDLAEYTSENEIRKEIIEKTHAKVSIARNIQIYQGNASGVRVAT